MGNLKWLLMAGLIAGGVKAYHSHPELLQWLRRHQSGVEGLDQALPSQIYFLETNRWLEFDVPRDTPLIRLISNASIAPENPAIPGTQWPYAVEYELRGRSGLLVASNVYHFRAQQLVFLSTETGKPVDVNTYLDRRFSPLGGRRCLLNLADPALAEAGVLRLRLHSSHRELLEVGVRIHFQSSVPERKVAYLWNRLSEDQKRDLARGNVYSFEGLTEREKAGLLRYRWAAAAPEGIPGLDFHDRTLYIRDDSESFQRLKDWVPFGIALDEQHRAVLPLTNAPSLFQIRLVDQTATSTPRVVSSSLFWHGERQAIEMTNLVWSGAGHTSLPVDRDGFLEVSSSHGSFVRAFRCEPAQTNELTPEPTHLLVFTASPTNVLEYAIDHVNQDRTLFRVDLRREPLPDQHHALPGSTLRYTLLDDSDHVVQAGTVTLTNALSAYDWLVTTNGLTNVTTPQSLCFVLPPEVRTLRMVSASEPVLVNAYSRPSRLVKTILVPEDYSPGQRLKPEQPSWFSVRPEDHLQRRQALQSGLVRVQPPLPERDPLIEAGEYEWESLLPEPVGRGHMILLPPVAGHAPRAAGLSFSYFPAEVGSEQRVRFLGEPWEHRVAPSLILVSDTGSPGSAIVILDGQVCAETSFDAPVNQIRLGDMPVGDHQLLIRTTTPVSAYLNHLESTTTAAYLQRFCLLAGSDTIRFPYWKQGAGTEVLVLRVFSPAEPEPQPFTVRLKLNPTGSPDIGPYPELTILEREARVTPNPVGRARLIAVTPAQLDDGQPVFVQVGPDVPPGQHELEVTVAATTPRWISLSRTSPGMVEKLEFTSKRSNE